MSVYKFLTLIWVDNALVQPGIVSSAGTADSLLKASHLTRIAHANQMASLNFAKLHAAAFQQFEEVATLCMRKLKQEMIESNFSVLAGIAILTMKLSWALFH